MRALSSLLVRVRDKASGEIRPDLARRVDLFRHWDVDQMKQGNRFCPLQAAEIPRRLVTDGIEFEIKHDGAWFCSVSMFPGPPGRWSNPQWLILEPGMRIERDLLLVNQAGGWTRSKESELECLQLLMPDMKVRRTYGGVRIRLTRPQGLRPPWSGTVIHVIGEGATRSASDDYVREFLWPHSNQDTEEKLLVPLPLGRKQLIITDSISEGWSGQVIVHPGEISDVEVTLVGASGKLVINALDGQGVPVPRAMVAVTGSDPGDPFEKDSLTLPLSGGFADSEGRFVMNAIPTSVRRVRILATASGFRKQQFLEDLTSEPIRIHLTPRDDSGFVSGRVIDSSDHPIAGAALVALPKGMLKTTDWSEQSCGGTDDKGQFRVGGLDPSWMEVDVVVRCQGYYHELVQVPVNSQDLVVTLRPELTEPQ